MRILGLDWGEVRIGVAVSDPLGITAQPLITLNNDKDLIENLKGIIDKYHAEEIILGLPKQLDGRVGIAAGKAKDFCEKLQSELPLKVSLWDERMTTKIAQMYSRESGASRKKGKSFLDAATAGIMLQSYMDSRRA